MRRGMRAIGKNSGTGRIPLHPRSASLTTISVFSQATIVYPGRLAKGAVVTSLI